MPSYQNNNSFSVDFDLTPGKLIPVFLSLIIFIRKFYLYIYDSVCIYKRKITKYEYYSRKLVHIMRYAEDPDRTSCPEEDALVPAV